MPINPAGAGRVSQPSQIDLASAGTVKVSTDIMRESAAWLIGLLVVVIFGASVFTLFHLGALLFTKFNGVNNGDFASFVKDALDPFLTQCATTLGTIFGSTLGFVFGYYFKATSAAASAKVSG